VVTPLLSRLCRQRIVVALAGAGAGGAEAFGFVVQLPAAADRSHEPAGGIRTPSGGQDQRITDPLRREPGGQIVGDPGGDTGAQPPDQRLGLPVLAGMLCMLLFFKPHVHT